MPGETVWPNTLNERAETIVKLREGIEPPLIILHGQSFFTSLQLSELLNKDNTGGGGSIHAFAPLKRAFTTPLWAIQVTRDTPRTSLEARIFFYYKTIVV